jgi:hypothetical protein
LLGDVRREEGFRVVGIDTYLATLERGSLRREQEGEGSTWKDDWGKE